MVEFGNSLDPDREFDFLLDILDFSLDDCLEEGEIADDWDIGDAQCLGPIPSNILMQLPMTFNEELDSASICGAPEQKKRAKQRKLARVQESGSFHTQTPVIVLDSNESDDTTPAQTTRGRSKQPINLGIYPELSTSKQTSNARRKKECRKWLPVDMDSMKSSPKNVRSSLNISDPALVKKCAHCQSSQTPEWRDGPLGPSTLCNACGLRHRSGCLFPEYRPLSSPTFVPSRHSNLQRKVAEMRNKAKRLKVEIKIDGAPEQTQLHVENTSSNFSLLESNHSYLKYRSEFINSAGTKPCVPPSPPGEKTSGEETSFEMQLENDDKLLDGSNHALLLNGSNPCPPVAKKKKTKKKCAHCESTKTPYWREEPFGARTLCSACGIQYRAEHQVPEYQPKASPTSVPSQHSNDHRNTTKMMQFTAGTKNNGAPEPKQLEQMDVDTSSHVSLLENSCSYSKYRSKHFKDAGAKPCVSPPSPCKKTSWEEKLFEVPIEYANDNSDSAVRHNASDPWLAVIKKCTHCQTTKTHRWSEGPLGPHTLSTASGMRYPSERLLPEYQPCQLSNSQTMLVKMMQPNADIKKRCCAHCQSTMTTKWRMGPLGRHTLCNACEQRYKAGSLVPEYRPKASPGFVPSQHSNRRNIMKRMQSTAGIEKRCAHCESTKTPAWLKGPLGPGTLCNACGKRYKAGRLFPEYRPERSPTFAPRPALQLPYNYKGRQDL